MLELLAEPKDKEALDRFLDLGLPSKKDEEYRYVRLKDLYERPFSAPTSFDPILKPELGTLVFVNGAYREELSSFPSNIVALPISKAMKTYGSFLKGRQAKLLQEEQDPFAALNGAYFTDALFLYFPPKCLCETPLKIIHIIDQLNPSSFVFPRIHLFLGREAIAKISFTQSVGCKDILINSFVDVALEERASLTFTSLFKEHETTYDLFALRATLKRESHLKSYSSTNGAATSREDYVVRLLGENADASLYGVWGLKGNRQHHIHVLMEHQQPYCSSLQTFKGTVSDASRSSFEGKIYVHKEAQKTQAYQMNHNLILGDRATANSKPNLEIFADDVKASHGATVGQIDEEQLFYLTTRGLSTQLARQMLVQGFYRDVLDHIEDPNLRQEAYENLC